MRMIQFINSAVDAANEHKGKDGRFGFLCPCKNTAYITIHHDATGAARGLSAYCPSCKNQF